VPFLIQLRTVCGSMPKCVATVSIDTHPADAVSGVCERGAE
jgi:hypothetical protein